MIEQITYLKNYYKRAAKAYIKAGRELGPKEDFRRLGLLNPSIGSGNLGDFIIYQSVKNAMSSLDSHAMVTEFPTQFHLNYDAKSLMNKQEMIFVGGTNLLSSNLNERDQWKIDKSFSRYIENKVVLLGCGWWQYQDNPNSYTSSLYQSLLNKNLIHSARDQYTVEKLREAGIDNVVNTSCPTLWSLSPDHCSEVNKKKSKSVITTVTFYKKDPEKDRSLINKLCENYEKVYLWVQGIEDLPYVKSLNVEMESIQIVAPTLDAYDRVLMQGNIDYIGSRLHAGIRALQHKVRAQIVAVDNRAMEIGKDVNLNVIPRSRVEDVMNFIQNDYETKIDLPSQNIAAWFESVQQELS